MTYEEARSFVDSYSHSGAPVESLDRTAALLSSLGNPQDTLRFIHIAGTNGKGSVTEYLSRTLVECGYRTGTLTSPYIRHYRDRIRMDLIDISKEAFCRICARVARAAGDFPYSQFEITMAIALCYFEEEKAQVVVLETGIGGRLDSTNIIEPPLVSIITPVSMDHMALLGNTLEEIAAQKAGILKKGSKAVFSCDCRTQALDVLKSYADAEGVPYVIPSSDECVIHSCKFTGSWFTYKGQEYNLIMGGKHQVNNAMTAIEAIEILRQKKFRLPQNKVVKALSETSVPARLQVLQQDPLVILDGGHNADGVGTLVRAISESGIPTWIAVCGMMEGKDRDAAAFQLALVTKRVICVDGFAEGAVPADVLAAAFTRQHAMAQTMSIEEALPYAIRWAKGSHGAVVICGSLYLANRYLEQEV
ncbi:MAG: bifunctional folylpolyglutamate synthase/dihydrofolate synthase [Oscillospiraceae bacterium]|nr:bifunctional folylpolyglutamate synthase/dihydrofolate synthase [Oscillospiraceae bacterium]